jgi:hypothetical protein
MRAAVVGGGMIGDGRWETGDVRWGAGAELATASLSAGELGGWRLEFKNGYWLIVIGYLLFDH